MTYFLISNGKDGGDIREFDTSDSLMEWLTDYDASGLPDISRFMETVREYEMYLWHDDEFLLIKGEIVVPRKREVIVTYEIE